VNTDNHRDDLSAVAGTPAARAIQTTRTGTPRSRASCGHRRGRGRPVLSAPKLIAHGTPPRGRERPEHPARAGTTETGARSRRRPGRRGNTPRGRGRRSSTGLRRTCQQEHPRAGGDDTPATPSRLAISGTPPRGRGRQPRSSLCLARTGNTPARAGTTGRWPPVPGCPPEHPRAGGDDSRSRRCSTASHGTPPRGRGRHGSGGSVEHEAGNTPARAGTTASSEISSPVRPEHPRAGGDDTNDEVGAVRAVGTPPRGRGRPAGTSLLCRANRNTPARAGTTSRRPAVSPGAAEHPRAGGDDRMRTTIRDPGSGTPPRGRGRPHLRGLPGAGQGNTPARAGTT